LEEVLPKEILCRPKKGFGVPIGKWFQKGEITVSSDIDYLNSQFIESALKSHTANNSDQCAFLWNMYILNNMKNRQAVA